tara:strand:+ start:367 stop:2181 length:1815 start_codon:yes stop_codon:yes gene_type:complete
MAANEELINAAASAYNKRKPTLDFSALNKAESSLHDHFDHKMQMKRDQEKRNADKDYKEYKDGLEEDRNEEVLEEVVEEKASDSRQNDDNYDEHGNYKGDFPELYPDFKESSTSLESNSPLTYNAGLVNNARQMYQGRRYSNRLMADALANAGKSIDGSIGDYIEMKTLEKETLKEEERLKKEKEQQEKERQEQVLNQFVLKSGENNIDQLGTDVYNQVQDQLYDLKTQYLEIYEQEDSQEKQRKLNEIMLQMTSLDKELTGHSTDLQTYQTNINEDNYSAGMSSDIKNLQACFYTNGTEVNYENQDWNFSKEFVNGKMHMVLVNPSASAQISNIENSITSLEEQKDLFTEEEYNNAMNSYQKELSQYKKVLNPKDVFNSSTVFGKTDGVAMNELFGNIDKIANNGQSESLQNIQGIIEQVVTNPKQLVSYANDPIPGQGKSMRQHFEDMFPNGIPIEDQNGDVVEYRTIDQIFNPQNPYYRENDGEKVLAELVKDYYTRISINRFNMNKKGNAQLIGIEGSDILGISNFGETTFGLSEEEGNKFRAWVNDNYPEYAAEIKLDRSFSSFTNEYITKAWQKLGEEYQKSTQFQEYDDMISKYYLK